MRSLWNSDDTYTILLWKLFAAKFDQWCWTWHVAKIVRKLCVIRLCGNLKYITRSLRRIHCKWFHLISSKRQPAVLTHEADLLRRSDYQWVPSHYSGMRDYWGGFLKAVAVRADKRYRAWCQHGEHQHPFGTCYRHSAEKFYCAQNKKSSTDACWRTSEFSRARQDDKWGHVDPRLPQLITPRCLTLRPDGPWNSIAF